MGKSKEVCSCKHVTKDEIREITDNLLVRLHKQLAERELKLELTPDAFELLQEEGFDPTMGARPMKRAKSITL